MTTQERDGIVSRRSAVVPNQPPSPLAYQMSREDGTRQIMYRSQHGAGLLINTSTPLGSEFGVLPFQQCVRWTDVT